MERANMHGVENEGIDAERLLETLAAGDTPQGGWEPVLREVLLAYHRLHREHSRVMGQVTQILRIINPELRGWR